MITVHIGASSHHHPDTPHVIKSHQLARDLAHPDLDLGTAVAPGKRRKTEATARLRALAIVDGAIRGEKLQPSEGELAKLGAAALGGKELSAIFPGITSVQFVTEGHGVNLSLRLNKKEGIPVQLVPEGTADATVIAVKRVDELGFYNSTTWGTRSSPRRSGLVRTNCRRWFGASS